MAKDPFETAGKMMELLDKQVDTMIDEVAEEPDLVTELTLASQISAVLLLAATRMDGNPVRLPETMARLMDRVIEYSGHHLNAALDEAENELQSVVRPSGLCKSNKFH